MRTDILQELERIVRLAGNLVREAHDIEQVTTEKTGAADLVTKYDVAVQGLLKRELLTLLTCHPYASGGKQRYLVICERA